jgi:MOSC domain-containing protein YiiM
MTASILAVSQSGRHTFSKPNQLSIRLLRGLGVEGDAHMGEKVRHRYHVARNPDAPNLRQVHLIHGELLDELRAGGFSVGPGDMGENITTRGVDLLGMSRGTRLRLGDFAIVEITGLRSPCKQIDGFAPGLMAAVLDKSPDGAVIRKSGVMAVVIAGGEVRPGDPIDIQPRSGPFEALAPV